MTWNEQLLMAIRNVLRAGSKTLLCVLAVCIGIGSVGLTSSLGSSAGSAVNAELRQIGIRGYVFYEKSPGTPFQRKPCRYLRSRRAYKAICR